MTEQEMERRMTILEKGLEGTDRKLENLFEDIHARESFSLSSRMLSLERMVERYRNLLLGGVAVLIFLSGYNAISIDRLIGAMSKAPVTSTAP